VAPGSAAAAASFQPAAHADRAVLRLALTERDLAVRTVALRRDALRICLRSHRRRRAHAARRARAPRCRAARHALKRARVRLARTERHVRVLARTSRRSSKKRRAGETSSRTSAGTTSTSGSGSTTGSAGTASGTPHPFEMGAVGGSALAYELPFIAKLHAHTARLEFSIGTPASQLAPIVEAYARAGVKPLLLASFYGTLPNAAEAQNLASWAQQFGPGGTLWQGREFPAGTAVAEIEFGNETSYSYQYPETASASNWYELEAYAQRAQTYALRFRAAYEAIQAANPRVGLLAQAGDGDSGSPEWVDNMFKAVPNLGQLAAGWTIHPYGPKWEEAIDRLISQTSAVGAPQTVPIYVTEWGLASDDGRCLSDNYGFNRCMTYQEAATALETNLGAMRSRYGSRLAAFYLFQARDQDAAGASTDREGYFGALQSDEAAKGAYTTAVQSLLDANP
jgi:hypothetical protein